MHEGPIRFPPSVRQIAGEMDVSVSQRCLISVRCSVYFRLFRGLLAGKLHMVRFLKIFKILRDELQRVAFSLFTELVLTGASQMLLKV